MKLKNLIISLFVSIIALACANVSYGQCTQITVYNKTSSTDVCVTVVCDDGSSDTKFIDPGEDEPMPSQACSNSIDYFEICCVEGTSCTTTCVELNNCGDKSLTCNDVELTVAWPCVAGGGCEDMVIEDAN